MVALGIGNHARTIIHLHTHNAPNVGLNRIVHLRTQLPLVPAFVPGTRTYPAQQDVVFFGLDLVGIKVWLFPNDAR